MRLPTRWRATRPSTAAKAKVTAHYFPEGKEPAYDKLRTAGVQGAGSQGSSANNILDTGKRIDGRDHQTVRPIVSEVGILPRAHGSACSPVANPGAGGCHARHRRKDEGGSCKCKAGTTL